MKSYFFVFFSTLVAISVALTGCSRETVYENNVDSLYAEMLSYSDQYSSIINEYKTKSSDELLLNMESSEFCVDISCVDEKSLEYLDIYTQPENIADWDEKSVLFEISQDERFSEEELQSFVKGLAFSYTIKADLCLEPRGEQKSPKYDQCYDQYKKSIRRSAFTAVIGLGFAALEPTIAGEGVIIAYYLKDVVEAKEDLETCLNREDHIGSLPGRPDMIYFPQ